MQADNAVRAEIESKIAALKRRRGAALCDGKPFVDDDELDMLECRLGALADIEAERTRRDRAQAERNRQTRSAALRTTLVGQRQQYLDAVNAVDEALHAAVRHLNGALSAASAMTHTVSRITEDSVPLVLGETSVVSRLSGRLAARMDSIRGHPGRFGSIEWSGGSLYAAKDDWQAAEARLLDKHLENFLPEEKKPNGKG